MPEQMVVTHATADTVKALAGLLAENPEEDVRYRCLQTLAVMLRSHNADVALRARNTLLSRAEGGDAYAVEIVDRLDRAAQPLLKKVNKSGAMMVFDNEYASLRDLYLLRMLRIGPGYSLRRLPEYPAGGQRGPVRWREDKTCFGPQVGMVHVHTARFSDKDLWILDRFDIAYMDLSESGVRGTGLRGGRWPNLEVLHLAGCRVTDRTVSAIHLPSLIVVDLVKTQIGKEGLRQLNGNQNGIRELWVSSPNLKGSDLSVLQEYRDLEIVRLHSDIIDSDAIDALSGCAKLRMIRITGHVEAGLLASLERSAASTEIIVVEGNGREGSGDKANQARSTFQEGARK